MALQQRSLRYAGTCRVCGLALPAKTRAIYDPDSKTVLCLGCLPDAASPEPLATMPPPAAIDHGVAGAGPRREYERRVAKREQEIDALGGWRSKLVRMFDTEPQSTTAWRRGAEGEQRLAGALDRELRSGAVVLHSRAVPNTRGDIDHLIVAPSGVWLVDAKNYTGAVEGRDVGKWLTIDRRLYVNGRDQSKLVDNFDWQVVAVRAVLDPMGFADVPVHPTLVFTQWTKRLFQKPIEIRGVRAMWIAKLVELVDEPGPLDADVIRAIATQLSAKLPAKG